MTIPKINSSHGSETRNIINAAIESINVQGESIQDLVAKGQLTPEQYSELLRSINGLISKGEVTLDDLSPAVLNLIAEGSGVPLNVLSIPREKSVDYSRTDFIFPGSNLFDISKSSTDKGLVASTGGLVDSTTFSTSDYISVESSKSYSSKAFYRVAFYRSDKTFISITSDTNLFTTPSQAKYVRLEYYNVQTVNNPQLNEGTTLKPFEPFSLTLSNKVKTFVGEDNILDNSVTIEKTNFIEQSSNLLDLSKMVSGYLASTTGEITQSQQYISSDFIAVNTDVISIIGIERVIFYDGDKKFISGKLYLPPEFNAVATLDVPEKARFIRISIDTLNTTVDNPQINEGSELLPFEEYYIRINGIKLEESKGSASSNRLYSPPFSVYPEYVSTGSNYSELTLEDLYEEYYRLESENPEYMNIKSFGKDQTGQYDVLEIKLSESGINPVKIKTNKPKIVIVANVHAYEKPSAYSTFYMIKALCEEWKNDPVLEYLRFYVDFVVMPVMNPWGFVNGGYVNGNGVNLQVNFPTRWKVRGEPDESMYAGPNPLSEVETQYCKRMIDENSDATVLLDLHAQIGTTEAAYTLMPNGVDYNSDIEIINKYVMEKITRHFNKHYGNPLYPHAGRIDSREGEGTIDAYSSSLGIPSNVIEHFLKFPYEETSYSVDSMKANTDYLIIWMIAAINQFTGS